MLNKRIIITNNRAIKIIGLSIIIICNRSRYGCVRADFINTHIIDNLLDPKILQFPVCKLCCVRQNPLDADIHASRGMCRNCFRIGDIMLVTDLKHLSATLHGNQKLAAQIGFRTVIV